MSEPDKVEIRGVAPCFVVRDVPKALAFYRDGLGFEITFEAEPDDVFFGIVQRGAAMLMFKALGVEPVPNYTRDVGKGELRWDAYFAVPDPDALAAEFATRDVAFFRPIEDTHDGLRGFEVEDPNGYILFFGRPL
ncbi:MAG: VOC family protein [Pyrinomonadaceae bacterium]